MNINSKITTGDTVEITDQDFLRKLVDVGFHTGRNNTPEDLQRILKNIPPQYHKDFLAGFNSR